MVSLRHCTQASELLKAKLCSHPLKTEPHTHLHTEVYYAKTVVLSVHMCAKNTEVSIVICSSLD